MAGCSGSGGHKDASDREAGVIVDGGSGQVDGGPPADTRPAKTEVLPPALDTAPATRDLSGLAAEVPPGADAVGATGGGRDAGGDQTDGLRDLPVGNADQAQGMPEVAVPRDVGVDDRADAPSSGGDTADAPPVRRDSGPDLSPNSSIVERLAGAAALCGPQSRLTVPVGWQMVLAGEKGCAFYAPPSWLVIGAGTPNTFVVEDSTRVTGSAVMAGVDTTGTATCTPHGVASWLFANNKDCVGFRELYWKDSVDVIAGIQIPRGDMVYSCTQSGVPIAGYLMVQIHGTWPMCNLLTFAFWMPETQIETRTCTLTQTLNSIQCPQGGGSCDDSTCAQSCDSGMGACDDNGACVCY
jgi:hypothetical protein